MTTYHSPRRDPRDLRLYGPRLEIRVGHPILDSIKGPDDTRYSTMPALIDTGAQRTILSSEAVRKVGLSKISETTLRGVGGVVEKVGVYVASIQFPHCRLAAIQVMEVACCDLSHPLIQCLLGRDVVARWTFTYEGPAGAWQIAEERVPQWVEPPEGIDLWGE